MKTKFFTIIMTTIAILCGFIMIPNCVRADDTTSSDFSNAEYTLEYNDPISCSLTISNVTLASDDSYTYAYYAYFTTSSSETLDANDVYTNGIHLNKGSNNDSLYIYTNELDSFVELNGDLYLWIAEYTGLSNDLVVSGQKIDKPDYPEYTDIFRDYTNMSYRSTLIVFNVPWGEDTTRTFEIKIGKITDTTILQSLKNGDSSSLSSLLTYSKSASSIYDENLTSDSYTYYNSTSISLSGLENEAYYYLYVSFDDEDGKYVPIEGVTYAQASVYESFGTWFLFFKGSDDFTWTDFDVSDTDTDLNSNSNEGKTDDSESTGKNDDTTTDSSSLPYTGAFRWILATIIVIGIIGGVCYTKTQKYKGI